MILLGLGILTTMVLIFKFSERWHAAKSASQTEKAVSLAGATSTASATSTSATSTSATSASSTSRLLEKPETRKPKNLSPKDKPTEASLQSIAQAMPPPRSNNKAMPPPSFLRPSAASTLRLPSTTGSSRLAFPTPASSSTLAPSARPSRKVILQPGHSPLDWANLTHNPPSPTFLRGVVPNHLLRVTPSELRTHNGRRGSDAWSTWQGKVYNVSPYLDFHPGGKGELMRGAGKPGEAEKLFLEVHPWVNWEGILGECMIGILVAEHHEASRIDEMD